MRASEQARERRLMRALAPFSWLSRWLDRRIDARIAAREARKRAEFIEFPRVNTDRPDASALRPKVGEHAPGWMGA